MEISDAIFTKFIAVFAQSTSLVVFALDAPVSGMTSGRARALVGVAFGLVSAIVGIVSLVRSKGRGGAIASAALGLIGIVLGVIHLETSTGGFGTGGGRAGAIVGLVLSVVGIALGGIAAARSNRLQVQ